MNNQLMIKIDHVSKNYRLGMIGGTTLREDLQRFSAKLKRKEDPTTKVGVELSGKIGDTFKALSDINLDIYEGEAVGIIGHNGAGKSTLLKLITRITAPTSGSIGLNGRIASMLEVGTGFHPELTGRENIYMNGAILGMTKKEIDSKIDEIIQFSEIEKFIDTPVKRYSSGMYVKLAFSVAAHLDSEIIIMDEVLAVGDMSFQKKCLSKMRKAASQENKTVLYVSHNMSTIRQLCDRVIVLDKGKVIFDGDVEQGISIYLGSNMNQSTKKDLSSFKRLDYLKRTDLRFIEAEYLNKDSSVFLKRELIHLRLRWKANMTVENVSMRIVIYASDESHLCASFCYNLFSGEKGKESEADLELDVSALAPGNYQSYYVFFDNDENGITEDIDQVRGLDFTIDDSAEKGRIPWRTEAWGHFELPQLKLDNLQEGQK